MEKHDEEFLTELRDHIEATLETWMKLNIQEHIERVMVQHLSAINKLEMDHEIRHSHRWRWLMWAMVTATLSNIAVIALIAWLMISSL